MSNNSFNPVQFGAALSRIVSHLGDANFIDSIAPEIAADSIESALSILESRLHYFSSCNFHPISAQITRILAFAYHIRNEPEKFVTYGFRCISPLYQRFLPTDSQIKFLEVLPNCPSVEVDVTQSSSVPFDILAGFEDEKSYPSDDVEFGFSIRSLLEYEISIDSISIAINHNKEGISSYKVLDTQVIKKHQKIKELIKLPIHKPGRISINSISIKIYNVVLNVKIFKQMGYNESVINPFDDECKFENPKALSIFLFNQGQATVSNCNFSNCQSCITLSQLSKLDTINCNFSNVKRDNINLVPNYNSPTDQGMMTVSAYKLGPITDRLTDNIDTDKFSLNYLISKAEFIKSGNTDMISMGGRVLSPTEFNKVMINNSAQVNGVVLPYKVDANGRYIPDFDKVEAFNE